MTMANPLAQRLGQLVGPFVERVALRAGFRRSVPGGVTWMWPGGFNNGDRGPPGTWQRNLNSNYLGQELIAFSAVYACINNIAADVSKLPAMVYAVDTRTGAKTPQREDYYVQLMNAPNGYQTHSDFMYAFVQSYLFQGNTYAYCKRNRRDEITSMHVLNPYRTTPLIADDGAIYYRCTEDFLAGLAPGQVVPARDMIHHRLPLLPGYSLIGVTPIFAAAASSAVGLKILQNSQQFFAQNARPSGMLVSDVKIADPEAARLKQEWDAAYSGAGIGKTALLSGGLKWEPLTITAQDAQLIEQLRWSVEDVGRVFRVPSFMLGDTSKVSYRNTEQLVRAYLTNCLDYHIKAIEERFQAAFEFDSGYEFKLDLSAMLRTEIDVRYQAYQQALNSGWQSINEVRAQEGLEPIDGGEVPRVQMQYVPIDREVVPQAPPIPQPGAGPAEPGEGDKPADPAEPVPEDTPAENSIRPDVLRVRAALAERRAA
jgi:HK97 family phage portal protein